MEYKDAFNILMVAWQGDKTKPNHPNFDDINEALDKIKELVDKATPTELYYEADGYADGELVYDTAICQNCGRAFEVEYDEQTNYCSNCGQRLDWGNDNGN